MSTFEKIIEVIFHLDKYLGLLIEKFGVGVLIILFLVIFAETGLVITPFLPGDSLLFAAGTIAAQGNLQIMVLFLILSLAAILGDSVNYRIGKSLGTKVFRENSKYFRKEYLIKTERFYEKYGPKTIILARFIPIIRTFAPFIAGIGRMNYLKFIIYNVIGGVSWVTIFLFGGYFFGNLPWVKENFELVLLTIIFYSFIPIIWEIMKHNWKKRRNNGESS